MAVFFDATAFTNAIIRKDEQNRQETTTPVVEVFDGSIFTTSLNVAKVYGKRHADVLRSVEAVKAECPPDFTERNFALSSYIDSTGRELPLYCFSRDGLVLLVMGYTGPKAMEHKLGYIRAFNAMEAKLQEERIGIPDFSDPAKAARAWADQYEARLLAEKRATLEAARADYAIATKGRIIAGRDSYLMQQRHEDLRTIRRKDDRNGKLEAMYAERGIELGAERVRADKAENALGVGRTYRCVTNIPWFREVFDLKNCRASVVYQQAGKRLKKLSDDMGYGYQTVPGHRFDSKAYHIDVIAEFRARLEGDPDLMGGYRK